MSVTLPLDLLLLLLHVSLLTSEKQITLFTLTAGQSFSSVYLSTLPHSSLDGLAYVWSWMGTVQLLHSLTSVVLESKVRSKALLSVFRYYYYLTEVRSVPIHTPVD